MPIIAARVPMSHYLVTAALFGLAANAHAATGCPWIPATAPINQGVVDTNAAYWSSLMPGYIQPGTTVQIYSAYPQMRFFNFTVYHEGKMIDHLADADLYPVEGGAPAPNVAALPDSNGYQDHYLITIKYEDTPAVREPNTLYAGSSTTLPRVLMIRNYLPNPGVDATGGVGLPQLTQINPDGSSQRYDTTSTNLTCPLVDWVDSLLYQMLSPLLGIAEASPVFSILPYDEYNAGNGLFPPYSNFDSGYGALMTSPAYGNLLLVRQQLPATPSSPVDPADLQARYLSLCAYHALDRLQMGCLTDAQMVAQNDGYVTVVVSTADARPPLANPAGGYNWLPWFNSTDREVLVLRQLLPDPDFPGNYQTAGNTPNPIAALGAWAPQATYCNTQTFNANASRGGAAVFAACRAATSHLPTHD